MFQIVSLDQGNCRESREYDNECGRAPRINDILQLPQDYIIVEGFFNMVFDGWRSSLLKIWIGDEADLMIAIISGEYLEVDEEEDWAFLCRLRDGIDQPDPAYDGVWNIAPKYHKFYQIK
jgi:hypothetical protein